MHRTSIINALIKKHDLKSYLEIGVDDPALNFYQVQCGWKVGVDPAGSDDHSSLEDGAFYRMTSDEFFADAVGQWDLIFIDGDHRMEQVARDLANAMRCVSEHGFIVMHDVYPPAPEWTTPESNGGMWCGEAYRVWLGYRKNMNGIAYVVTCDYGVGVIVAGSIARMPLVEMPDPASRDFPHWWWAQPASARDELLGAITPAAFRVKMGMTKEELP